MRFFSKPTVGSRLVEASEQIVSEEQQLRSLIESHNMMAKDKVGRLFSPLTRFQTNDLAQIINNKK